MFQALGDDALTVREIVPRAQEIVGEKGDVYESYIRAAVNRMFKAGELDRRAYHHGAHIRYRYLRPKGLTGPIAELERNYHDDERGA